MKRWWGNTNMIFRCMFIASWTWGAVIVLGELFSAQYVNATINVTWFVALAMLNAKAYNWLDDRAEKMAKRDHWKSLQ